MLDAGDRIAVARRAADGDQNISRAHTPAVGKLDGMRIDHDGAAFDDGDAGIFQRLGVGGLETSDFFIFVGDQGRPIKRPLRHRPAITCRILEFGAEARGVDQKLLGHAAANDAGAADPIFLGQHHPRAALGGHARGANAPGTAAYDEIVDVEIR